jgi:hypothetical protein
VLGVVVAALARNTTTMSSYLDTEQIPEHALGGMLVYERPEQ